MNAPLRRSAWLAGASLVAGTGTLVCCVLPVVMVALGAGATLAALVTAVPALVWLSAHKGLVFGIAGVAVAAAGGSLWRARSAPCPVDPVMAAHCRRMRGAALAMWAAAVATLALGVVFAFVLPRWR